LIVLLFLASISLVIQIRIKYNETVGHDLEKLFFLSVSLIVIEVKRIVLVVNPRFFEAEKLDR